jgi:hypothetical protein
VWAVVQNQTSKWHANVMMEAWSIWSMGLLEFWRREDMPLHADHHEFLPWDSKKSVAHPRAFTPDMNSNRFPANSQYSSPCRVHTLKAWTNTRKRAQQISNAGPGYVSMWQPLRQCWAHIPGFQCHLVLAKTDILWYSLQHPLLFILSFSIL